MNGEQTSATQSFTELDEPSPQDFYSISKWQAEQALRHIAQETGLEIVIVRPPLVYPLRVKRGVEGDFARVASAANCNPPFFFTKGGLSGCRTHVTRLIRATKLKSKMLIMYMIKPKML